MLDSLDRAAPYLARAVHLAVVAKSAPDRIRTFADERGWRNLRLLSARGNAYSRDYHGESPDGSQIPLLNVFTRDGAKIRHFWASEMMFAPHDGDQDKRRIDSIWPLWNVLDVTPGGRDSGPDLLRFDDR